MSMVEYTNRISGVWPVGLIVFVECITVRKVGGSLHQCLRFLQLALEHFFMLADSFRYFRICLHGAVQSCYHMHVCSTSRMIFSCKAECAVERIVQLLY